MQKAALCHGQMMRSPLRMPSSNGPPAWGQVAPMACTVWPSRISRIFAPSTSTGRMAPSGRSVSAVTSCCGMVGFPGSSIAMTDDTGPAFGAARGCDLARSQLLDQCLCFRRAPVGGALQTSDDLAGFVDDDGGGDAAGVECPR